MENCPQHEALEFRVKQAEKKIELIDHQLTNLDKNEAVLINASQMLWKVCLLCQTLLIV